MKITEKIKEMIINFGAFGYDNKKMALVLGINKADIDSEMNNKDSEFNTHYLRGKALGDYAIDLKLFELARGGDIKALDKLTIRKRAYK
jgi:hypothetical protein